MKFLFRLYGQKIHNEKVLSALINRPANSPIMKLRKILAEGFEISNTEAMLRIYGRRNNEAFSVLKNKMKDHLINSLITTNLKYRSTRDQSNELYSIVKESVAARALISLDDRDTAALLLEKSLEKAIERELTDDIIIKLKLLINLNISKHIDAKKINDYYELFLKWHNVLAHETKSSFYTTQMVLYRTLHLDNINDDLAEQWKSWTNELKFETSVNTFYYEYTSFLVEQNYLECIRDYETIINNCNLIEQRLKTTLRVQPVIISAISCRKMWALLHLKQFDKCSQQGKRTLRYLQNRSNNWYRVNYYLLKSYLYSRDYTSSLALVNDIFSIKNLKAADHFIELFTLITGYLYLIKDSGIDPVLQDLPLPEFRMARFLNSAPIYSKDKSGMNISILLLQIAFMLQKKNFIKAADRIESLRSYASKYLRRNETFRSNCMMKMIMEMAKADFNPRKTERYTATLRAQLDEMPLHSIGGNIEVEVIPFEDLWEIIMRSLEK